MTYNPLIGDFVSSYPQLAGLLDAPEPGPWWQLANKINDRIERAASKGLSPLKDIAELELYDPETAAYWRERGLALYGKGKLHG